MVKLSLPAEHAFRSACSRALRITFLGSQEVAVRSAYARAKPG
ncbi:hypothetical protein [Pollutimonas bauzanensis]|nr:hypothetical protein [Pollutimonas bauzanensis]